MENTIKQEEELNKNEGPASEGSPQVSQEAEKTSVQQDELVKVQAELAEFKDKYLRLYSEFENFRRRTAKEKIEMIQGANENLIKSILPVIDDFERAEKAIQDTTSKDLAGYVLIYNKFKKILEQYSVKTMDIQTGSDFSADLHEAITQIPAPEEKLKGKIIDVVEKGYLLNDKVIRFAKVVVGS